MTADEGSPAAGMEGRSTGFTLLELLVALAVFGLLLVGLRRGVETGLRTWDAQTARVAETSDLDAAARALRAVLTTAQPARPARTNTPGIAFTGEADRLTLVADMPTGLGTTRRAEITLERSGDDRIVLRWLPRRHEVPLAPPAPPVEATILQHVRDIEFGYWGASAAGGPAAWQQRWNAETSPGLIRIRVRFAATDHRHWPDLVVAPLLTGPAG